MDLFRSCQIFVAVTESGGMSEAGRRLECSKAVVSRAVGGLETRLGVRLLDRTTRRVTLTEQGAEYLQFCRAVIEQSAEIEARFSGSILEPEGTLAASVPVSLGTRAISPLLPAFYARYPGVRIELDLSDRPTDPGEQGLDLAIRFGGPGPGTPVTRRIGETRHLLAGAPGLLELMGGPPKSIAGLSNWPMLVHPAGPGPAAKGIGEFGRANVRLSCNSGEILAQMAVAGMGLCYLPRFLLVDDIAAGRLKVLLAATAYEVTPIHAVYPRRRLPSLKTRLFVDFLAERLAESTN